MVREEAPGTRVRVGGLTGWLLGRLLRRLFKGLRTGGRVAPRLALVERIALAPRQSVALIEAEGRRILVATSADGASAFYPLDRPARAARQASTGGAARISW